RRAGCYARVKRRAIPTRRTCARGAGAPDSGSLVKRKNGTRNPAHAMKLIVAALVTLCASQAVAQSAPDAMRIRERRLAQSRAMALRDGARAASFWTEDITLRRGLGHAVNGRGAYRKLVEAPPSATNLVYERQPT